MTSVIIVFMIYCVYFHVVPGISIQRRGFPVPSLFMTRREYVGAIVLLLPTITGQRVKPPLFVLSATPKLGEMAKVYRYSIYFCKDPCTEVCYSKYKFFL